MKISPFLASLLLAALAAMAEAQATPPATAPAGNRFEPNVRLYEESDKQSMPPAGAILLVGDSQFFRWKTVNEDLPGYTIINRGIDSFQTSDVNYFFDRLVTPYKPRMIIMHAGGNDVHTGKTTAQILTDYRTFVGKVRKILPTVPILISSTTPGPARWDEADKRKELNKALKDYAATEKNIQFVDLWDAMLTPDGKPREDLWVEDRIHPNHEGYLIRVRIMKPMLGPPDKSRNF
jgi:lysophospholipase L1-like esterase